MIIRHFEIKDIKDLKKYRYPDKSDLEILSMINEWNKAGCSGRYFEMFTIINAGQSVGEISIYEHTKESVSIGINVFEPFRQRGFATKALDYAMNRGKELNYEYAVCLVEKNNLVAIKFFTDHGFEFISEFINPKGIKIVNLKKRIQ